MPDHLPANAAELGSMAERNSFGGRLGIEIEEWTVDRVVGSMPVEGNTQPDGILHGGATCSLVESLRTLSDRPTGMRFKWLLTRKRSWANGIPSGWSESSAT